MSRKAKPPVEERLELRYVPVSTVVQWERNAKKHDFGALWQSIHRHGFKDPPAFDLRLNSGKGGIVEGNGRSHVLKEMQAANESAPRGILIENEQWLMPVLFGVDADSERAAEAYGITHNNMVLSGGDFGATDYAKLWDETEYTAILADLAAHDELPVGIDGDDVDALIADLAGEGYDSFDQTQKLSKGAKGEKPTFGVLVVCEGEGDQAEKFQRLRDEGYECVKQGVKPPGVKR